MSIPIQYNFFESKEESTFLAVERRVDEIDKSCHKIRRGIFAKHAELQKKHDDLERRLAILENNICKGVLNG